MVLVAQTGLGDRGPAMPRGADEPRRAGREAETRGVQSAQGGVAEKESTAM